MIRFTTSNNAHYLVDMDEGTMARTVEEGYCFKARILGIKDKDHYIWINGSQVVAFREDD